MKNPRFKVNKAPIFTTMAGLGDATDVNNPFKMNPKVVVFSGYQIDGLYEIALKIINGSQT